MPRGRYNSPCLDGACVDVNTECRDDLCLCARHYFERDGVCVPRIAPGGQCQAGDVCNDTNAECRNGICQCPPGSVIVDGVCGAFAGSQRCSSKISMLLL